MGKQHLESLRQRLYSYRTQLEWPADETTRNQFENILKLLFNFASQHILDYFSTIRAEFANWILHKQDPYLSEIARNYFDQLSEIFENHLAQTSPPSPIAEWEKRIVFDERISTAEMSELKKVFVNTRFLKKTVLLAYNETDINLLEIPERGIWVTKIGSVRDFDHYRISLNTVHGKHFDLHFMLAPVLRTPQGMETVYWHAAIASHPYASNSLPGLGCHSVQYGALATRFVSDLNVSEKIRGFAGLHNSLGFLRKPSEMRKLYVKGMSEIFNVWHHSGYRIVPGNITPSNVVVPELDYLDSAILISIAGHHPYTQPSDLFEPLVVNFFTKVVAFYPWVRYQIQLSWVFDAAREVLNPAVVANLLEKLHEELKQKDVCYLDESLLEALEIHLQSAAKQFYVPLPLFNAIDKYDEWRQLNPMATYAAKEETIWELADLYKLHNLPEIGRFYMYRMTYFAETTPEIAEAFDLLLHKMNLAPSTQATRFIELSLLQEAIGSSEDLQVFSKMVFPRMQQRERFDILKIGAKQKEEIIVLSYISDKKGNIYTMRAPIEAREIGQLYHLFYEENYPKSISEMDQHFVVLDSQDRVIGGLCYIPLDHHVVLLDGAAVSHQLKGRGIGSAMIEAFSTRMSALGIVAIKAHFLRGNFYLKLNFKVDKKWGALVKFLS
jgi:predicted GNAT family acetyltransferase